MCLRIEVINAMNCTLVDDAKGEQPRYMDCDSHCNARRELGYCRVIGGI